MKLLKILQVCFYTSKIEDGLISTSTARFCSISSTLGRPLTLRTKCDIQLIFVLAVVAGLDKAKIDDKKPEEKVDLSSLPAEEKTKQVKKRNKLLRQIEELEAKKESGEELTPDQKIKIDRKQIVLDELKQLQN